MASQNPEFNRTDTPVFGGLNLSNASNQLQLGLGTVTWAPTAARTLTLPDITGTLIAATTAGDITTTGMLTVGKALFPAVGTPTYAATVSLNPLNANVFVINAVHATGDACTANLLSVPTAGERIDVIVTSDNANPVITFGTSFASAGTVTPGANKTIVVTFVSNGTKAVEIARSAAV